jgi:prepilin-type N-terminal cleavage/methylation domain-containing protein
MIGKKTKNIKRAFTLIELLIVIMIVGILSGFIFVSMNSAITASKDAKRKADLSAIAKAISMYSAQNGGALPSTGTSCDVCNGCAGACANLYTNIAPYLTSVPTDPTGSTVYYKYTYSATLPSFTLQSTLSTGYTYQFDSSTDGFSTLSYVSTCASATNAQVSCSPITINSTEEACKCTYLSGAGQTNWMVPNGITSVQYLVVAGGGGGGGAWGGGGGGGGLLTGTASGLSGSQSIIVGAGGAGNANGSNSLFGSISAVGGGAGGNAANGAGTSGGSGGGGAAASAAAGAGTIGQGNNGGVGGSSNRAGGGGGAGTVGTVGPAGAVGIGGIGGDGLSSSITGILTYYAGGGGGGNRNTASGAAGGLGGGGMSGQSATGTAGTPATGGGGGGGTENPQGSYYNGGAGGSGVVIFRYTHP